MSIQKKSLISTLKTTKKANVAAGPVAEGSVKKETVASMRRVAQPRAAITTKVNMRRLQQMRQMRQMKDLRLKSAK
jgi:hypothetical protein